MLVKQKKRLPTTIVGSPLDIFMPDTLVLTFILDVELLV